jgi:hypothetical protein
MPQLDIFSWLNQVLFTVVMIFSFYVLLILVFLPITTGILKGRNKLQISRNLSITLLSKQALTYIYDTNKTLTTIFVNNLIIIWQYFLPSNNVMLQNEINNTCYTNSAVELQKAYLDYSLVNLLSKSLDNQDMENEVNDIFVVENVVEKINNSISN